MSTARIIRCTLNDMNNIIEKYSKHSSITAIKGIATKNLQFKFEHVSPCEVFRQMRNLNSKKSAGYDLIPPKLVKAAAGPLCGPLSTLINKCISNSRFPEVRPLLKRGDSLNKISQRTSMHIQFFRKDIG